MSILAACPCGTQFSAPDHAAGKLFKCPACGQTLQLPGPEPSTSAPQQPAPQQPAAQQPIHQAQYPAQQPVQQQPVQQQPVHQPVPHQPAQHHAPQQSSPAPYPRPQSPGSAPPASRPQGKSKYEMQQAAEKAKVKLLITLGVILFLIAVGGGAIIYLVVNSNDKQATVAERDGSDSDEGTGSSDTSNDNSSDEDSTNNDLFSDPENNFGKSNNAGSTNSFGNGNTNNSIAQNNQPKTYRPGLAGGRSYSFGNKKQNSSSGGKVNPFEDTGKPQNSGGSSQSNAGSGQPELSLADLVERVEPSVVRIDIEGEKGGQAFKSIGSGFVVSSDGRIVTNFHVMEGAEKAKLTFSNGQSAEIKYFQACDMERDLCLIKIDPGNMNLRPLPFKNVVPRKGEKVAAFGCPLGFDFSATEGVVSAIRTGAEVARSLKDLAGVDAYKILGYTEDTQWIQTTSAISGGNSGGPLVDMQGQLVGVNTWSNPQGQSLNFAATTQVVQHFINQANTKNNLLASLPTQKKLGGSEARGDISRTIAAETVVPVEDDVMFVKGKRNEVRRFEGHKGAILDLALSSDGRYLASTSNEGRAFVFDMKTGKALYQIMSPQEPIRRVDFSKDFLFTFRTLILSPTILSREPDTGKLVGNVIANINLSNGRELAVSPDGRTVFACWDGGEAYLLRISPLRDDINKFTFNTYDRRKRPITAAFSPNGRYVVVGDHQGKLASWSGSGSTLNLMGFANAHVNGVRHVAFDPNGEFVVSAGEDGVVRKWLNWSKKSWRRIELEPPGAISEVMSLDVSPNSKYVAAGFANNKVVIWDQTSKEVVKVLDDHTMPVTCAKFTMDGKFMVTSCADKVLRIFSLTGLDSSPPKEND